MSQRARIAIIGTGWWATSSHMPAILQNPDGEIVAICDRNQKRLDKAGEAYQITKRYTDHLQMLKNEELDGVIVATPHATHYNLAADCLKAKLHLLIEKPMTLHAWEAHHLIDLANATQREIVVGYPYPYFYPLIRSREAISNDELGNIEYVNACFCTDVFSFLNGTVNDGNSPVPTFMVNSPGEEYNNPELLGGGEGHLQLTHIIGGLCFVTQLRARKVHALMNNLSLAVDLVDAMTVQFESGAIGIIGGSGKCGNTYDFNITVCCEKGAILLNTTSRKGVIRLKNGKEEDMMEGIGERPHRKYAIIDNFIDVILKRAPNGSPGENGWRTVEILDAAYRSAGLNGAGVYISDLYSTTKEKNNEN